MNRHSAERCDRIGNVAERVAEQRGAALVEYVLLLSLIVLVTLAGVSAFGGSVSGSVDDSASRVVAVGK
jgi:Flp pilus assembly pilin Flp